MLYTVLTYKHTNKLDKIETVNNPQIWQKIVKIQNMELEEYDTSKNKQHAWHVYF